MQLFVPYVYVPSAEATYIKIVTPLGELHVDKSVAWQALATVSVLLVTLVLYRLCFGQSKNKSKKAKKATRATSRKSKQTTRQQQQEEAEDADESSSGSDDDDDGEDDGRSALDESILKKGEHSYYYAHQRRVAKDDTKDGDAIKKTMVSTYGWVDNKTTVSIYLRDDAVVDMQEEQLILNWTKTSLSLDLLTAPKGDQAKSLVIPTLYSHIKDVAWKVKKNQLTLTLTKEKSTPWKSLNGAAKNLEDHIEYDESLYE